MNADAPRPIDPTSREAHRLRQVIQSRIDTLTRHLIAAADHDQSMRLRGGIEELERHVMLTLTSPKPQPVEGEGPTL